jgi:nicotinamidase-related amidase
MVDCRMKQALLVIDVQPSFAVPPATVAEIAALARRMPSIATVERHDETMTPFARQLGWTPPAAEESLVPADRLFVKHGYLLPAAAVDHLRELAIDRVLVCGVQAETCVLAAGFALFDAGLSPTLLSWLTVGSSLDPSGELGARLWRHHFGAVLESREALPLA